MRIIRAASARAGMRLGKTIYSETGTVLACSGFELSDATICKLIELGFSHLCIEEPGTGDIVAEQPLRDETLIKLTGALGRIADVLTSDDRQDERLPLTAAWLCEQAADQVVDDLKDSRSYVLPALFTVCGPSADWKQSFIEHAINVCVYSVKFAIMEGLCREELLALAMGAMLHDIGSLGSSSSVFARGANTSWTIRSYHLIKESGLPLSAAHGALFHRERVNGEGGPFGLTGDQITRHAKWIGLMDCYERWTSGRDSGKPLSPADALEALYAGAATRFDHDMVCLVRDHMAAFPPGLTVKLSSGQIGVVARLNPLIRHRPVVRILSDASGSKLSTPYEIDMAKRLDVVIGSIGEGLAAAL